MLSGEIAPKITIIIINAFYACILHVEVLAQYQKKNIF